MNEQDRHRTPVRLIITHAARTHEPVNLLLGACVILTRSGCYDHSLSQIHIRCIYLNDATKRSFEG